MKKAKKATQPKESKEKLLPLPTFDDVMRRLFRVQPPGKGRNQDYVEANRRRKK